MKKIILAWIDKNNKSNTIHQKEFAEIKKIAALYYVDAVIRTEAIEIKDMRSNYILICSTQAYKSQKQFIKPKQYNLLGIIIYCTKIKENKKLEEEDYIVLVSKSFLQVQKKIIQLMNQNYYIELEQDPENPNGKIKSRMQESYEDDDSRLLVFGKSMHQPQFYNPEDYLKKQKHILDLFKLDFDVQKDFLKTRKYLSQELRKIFKDKSMLALDKQFEKIDKANNLTELIKLCIYLYTLEKVNLYTSLNIILKNIRMIKFQNQYAKLKLFVFLLLLNYFYFYNNSSFVEKVYRYTDYVPSENQQEEKIITVCNFYSTSKKEALENFKQKKTKIIIETFDHSKSSDSLSFFNYIEAKEYSAYEKQDQIIFAPFTRFKITKIIRQPNQIPQNIVYLKQIPYNFFLSKIYDINLLQENLKISQKIDREINYQLKYQKILNAKNMTNSKQMAKIYSNLGVIYTQNNNYKWALNFYKKALQIRIHFKQEYEISTIYNNLGVVCSKLEKYKESLQYFDKVYQIRLKIEGSNSKNLISILNNKASLYQCMNDNKKSLEVYQIALKICTQSYPYNHVNRAMLLNNIGYSKQNLGEYQQALKCFQQARKIYEYVCGQISVNTGICFQNIGRVYEILGKQEEAIKNYEKAIQIQTKTKGDYSKNLQTLYYNLGSIYNKKSNYQKSKECFERALKISMVNNGSTHSQTALLYNNIGSLYESLGYPESAINYFEKGLQILYLVYRDKNTDLIDMIEVNLKDLKQKISNGYFKELKK